MTFLNVIDDLLGISHLTQKKAPVQDFEKVLIGLFKSDYDGTTITVNIDGKEYSMPKEEFIKELKDAQVMSKRTKAESIIIMPSDGNENLQSFIAQKERGLKSWCCYAENYNKKMLYKECWNSVEVVTPVVFKNYAKLQGVN